MPNLRIVKAEGRHVDSFLPDIRFLDNEEWIAGTGMCSYNAISASVALGNTGAASAAWAVVGEDGVCWALWGVQAGGIAWMVASKKAARHLHSMHRLFKQGIADMHALYPHLEAWAYAENTLHHRWMERFGWVRSGYIRSFALPGFHFIHFTRDV